jgi:iron complex outermembrane receptor protein
LLPAEFRAAPVPHVFLPATVRNDLFGETYGAEFSVTWQPLDAWRLRVNYTLLRMQLHTRGPVPSLTEDTEGNSPRHQFSLSSHLDFGRTVEWGLGVRYVDALEAALLRIPAYTELETRLAWKPNRHCELAVVGQNLLHGHHPEFNPVAIYGRNVQVDRAVYAKVTLRF